MGITCTLAGDSEAWGTTTAKAIPHEDQMSLKWHMEVEYMKNGIEELQFEHKIRDTHS